MCVCVRQKKLLKHSCIGTFFATNPKTPTWTIFVNETHWPWRWIACSTHLTAHASGARGTDTLSSGFLCFRIWHWLAIVELVNCDILQMYKFNVVKHCSNTESRVKPIFFLFCNARGKRFIAFKLWIVPDLCFATVNHGTFNFFWASLLTWEAAESHQ